MHTFSVQNYKFLVVFASLYFVFLIYTAIYLPNWGARPNLGATRPRVGIANLGFDAPSWQYLN